MSFTTPIATPPWTTLGKKIESATRKALYEYQMVQDESPIAIALSGGKDSLTLLYMLCAIRGRGLPNFPIHAYMVTGEYSCGSGIQANSLKAICKQLNVDFTTLHQEKHMQQGGCYPCSRERRKLIFNQAKEDGIYKIAFGHHQDDSIETLMMNLLHKGEFAANLAKVHMQKYGITLLRPLIFVSEADIVNFSKLHHFNRVICKCPIGQESMRKKTGEILNHIEKHFPSVRTNLALAGRVYGSDKANKP